MYGCKVIIPLAWNTFWWTLLKNLIVHIYMSLCLQCNTSKITVIEKNNACNMSAVLHCKLGYRFPSPSHHKHINWNDFERWTNIENVCFTLIVCKLYLIVMRIKFPWMHVITLVMFNSLEIAFICQNETNTYPWIYPYTYLITLAKISDGYCFKEYFTLTIDSAFKFGPLCSFSPLQPWSSYMCRFVVLAEIILQNLW